MQSSSFPVTQLLDAAARGEASARNRLWKVIYDELHALAQRQMAAEAPGRTLQPTSLVHEVYLRLVANENVQWSSRRHFFGAAANAMRQIRIDDARRRKRQKRGGGQAAEHLVEEPPTFDQDPAEVLDVDEALKKLEAEHPRKAEVVQYRYFAGMTEQETASLLGVARRTVQLDWEFAKAWLHRELGRSPTTF